MLDLGHKKKTRKQCPLTHFVVSERGPLGPQCLLVGTEIVSADTLCYNLKCLLSECQVPDNWLCGICGEPLHEGDDIQIDHIKPLSKGGTDAPDNLQPAHALCNIRKANF